MNRPAPAMRLRGRPAAMVDAATAPTAGHGN